MILKPKILVLYSKSGCCYWRSWKPLKELQKQGLAEVEFLELRFATKKQIAEEAYKADVIQALGLLGTSELTAIRQYKQLGVKIHVDYDDLYFNVSPWNPAYRNFGMEDVEVTDPTTGDVKALWKDGQNGFDIKRNKVNFHAYQAILKEANVITTTTLYLQSALQEIAEGQANVVVLPNAIDFKEWKPLDVRDSFKDTFRFGWAVSGSHGEDWLFIRGALIKFLKNHPDARFVCIGDTYFDIKQGMAEVQNQIEWYPFSDLWEGHYAYRMPMLGLDCAIAPLADNEFNRCKSPLKFEEYTAFGWPTIAQNMTPYKEHIISGETGLLASDEASWLSALESLYQNKKLRDTLRFNALLSVKSMFDITEIAKEYYTLYSNLLTGVPHE